MFLWRSANNRRRKEGEGNGRWGRCGGRAGEGEGGWDKISGQEKHASHEKQTTLAFLYSRSRKRRGTFRISRWGQTTCPLFPPSTDRDRSSDRSAPIFNEQTDRERGGPGGEFAQRGGDDKGASMKYIRSILGLLDTSPPCPQIHATSLTKL